MLNYIWLAMILIGVFVAGILGRITGSEAIGAGAFQTAKAAVNLAIGLVGGMMLWLGMLRLADKAGFINVIARAIRPLMKRLFPDVPAEHPAMGAMIMNMAANMLGLGNAATPLGLKAMQELESLNLHKGTATNAMCTFLAINTSSVTLIPASAMIWVSASGIENPFAFVVPAILATLCSTAVAIIAVKTFQKLPFFRVREGTAAESDENVDSEANEESVVKPVSPRGKFFLWLLAAMMLFISVLEFHPTARDALLEKTGLQQVLDDNVEAKKLGADWRRRRTSRRMSF